LPLATLHGVHAATWLSVSCPRDAMHAGKPHKVAVLSRCIRQSAYSGLVAPLNRSLPNLEVRPLAFVPRLRWDTARGGLARIAAVDVVEIKGPPPDALQLPPIGQALTFAGLGQGWERHLAGRYSVRARRATILAAGAIGTPALLQRSGVGTPQNTANAEMSVSPSSPRFNASNVGKGLRDRVAVCMWVASHEPCRLDPAKTDEVPSLFAYFNFSTANGDTPQGAQAAGGPLEAELNVVDGCIGDQQALTLRFVLQRTEASGNLHVVSPHPLVAPHAELVATSADLRRLMQMLRWFFEHILQNPAMAPLVAGIEPNVEVLYDDNALMGFIRTNVAWYQHPSGTLAANGLVDQDLRLQGTLGVSVADASVLPNGLPSGHPDVPIRMLGELVAQSLLSEHEALEATKRRRSERRMA